MKPVTDGVANEALERIDAACREAEDATTAFLAELVRHESTLGNEAGVQRVLAGAMRDLDLDVEVRDVDMNLLRSVPGHSPAGWDYAGRPNVVGSHRVERPAGRSLILNGHVDVVPAGPVAMWTRPPFEPTIRDGRMYGRGAGDMKSGIAAFVHAYGAIRAAGFEPASDVHLQTVVEEECTGNGALATVVGGYRADGCVIPEPFDHTLLVAQLGVLWLHVTVQGRPTHVLEATAGADAIRLAYEVIGDLRVLEEAMNDPAERHEAYRDAHHPINLNVGRIDGGEWTSSVPASCTFSVRIGFFPGTTVEEVKRRVEERIAAFAASHPVLREAPPTIRYEGFHAEACTVDRDEELVHALARAHEAVHGDPPATLASTATTDVRHYVANGVPATCYGPEARAIHGVDESVDLASVHRTTRVLARFVAEWCGLRPRGRS